ncbi:hypothetical protein C1H46_035400 [Malus baccata]|uniref:RING-type E3 ubiquitin transferase n=1 Tax=Malus baccata TaxID=106549 RepID=A0A540KXT5_MALBA|nr:hypothetical protein C1H46_035400 [Malus baccata]
MSENSVNHIGFAASQSNTHERVLVNNCSGVSVLDRATYEEIDILPKFKFRRVSNSEKVNGEVQASEGFMTEWDANAPTDHPISQADAECCVCLSVYKNGAELSQHPCQDHFHCTCVDKWLHINATCPMCKFNILKPRDRHEIGLV